VTDYSTDTRYVETVPAHPILGVLILAAIGLLVYLSVTVPYGIPQKIVAFVILVLGFVYASFMKMQITITSTRLTVGFGVIKHRININNIERQNPQTPMVLVRWIWNPLGIGLEHWIHPELPRRGSSETEKRLETVL